MSGGSWQYLCWAPDRSENLWEKSGQVREMADRLVELGYPNEAEEMYVLAIRLDQARIELESRWRNLADVMHAVEWRDSGDYGDDSLRAEIEARRVGVTP